MNWPGCAGRSGSGRGEKDHPTEEETVSLRNRKEVLSSEAPNSGASG